jgi:argininosuccinate lyase
MEYSRAGFRRAGGHHHPNDRNLVAELLGFSGIVQNSQDGVSDGFLHRAWGALTPS